MGLLLAGEGEDNLDTMMGAQLKINHCREKDEILEVSQPFPCHCINEH